ncbi:hypothetical protein J2T60_002601 [Natronospira proteinivora]|uniref:Secreted protein n=1 Tax=Natronospira proteinivora TaxID=1807133 RepID=A0ABT1GF78_9GAMM|nr:hypothetical protein [Natronospira proteinivora]MCP1728587.1 hypothetical protein [Natronospira proteinivora]
MKLHYSYWLIPVAALMLAACETDEVPEPETDEPGMVDQAEEQPNPQDEWWDRLQALCGNAYAGEMVQYDEEADEGWLDVDVIMHVRECSESEIRIPLHVGDNRSRTWILTRSDDSITLKHDHRYPDGSAEALHMYGGTTDDFGSAYRQEFPVGEFSQDLFHEEGIPDSAENTWYMEVHPGERFTYGLSRFNREFQGDFDLSDPVEEPPAPWVVTPEE